MTRQRRLLLASMFTVWAGMVLACGGAGEQAGRPKQEVPKTTTGPAGDTKSDKAGEAKSDKPVDWTGKLGTGKLRTGAAAYDELPDPWRSQFLAEWKAEVAASKNAVASAESSFEKLKAAAGIVREDLTKFENRNKEELRTKDPGFLQMHKERKASLAKSEEQMKDAEMMFLAAQDRCFVLEKNNPPYFKKPFDRCRTPRDIEICLAHIDAQNRGEAPKQTEVPTRFAEWGKCFDAAAGTDWGASLRPIPATVVDKGTLRFVPYKSFKAGDYEVNVYGDPDHPAGVEVGIRGVALDNPKAKANCFGFVANVLLTDGDRKVLGTLKKTEDLKKFDGLTFEVTPPTAEDAYGGWWVSVYDESELNHSRATQSELAAITVAKHEIKDAQPGAVVDVKKPPATGGSSPVPSTPGYSWTADDVKYARPTGMGSGGRVYVHSYTRKDGTFVQGHTRSAPTRR